MKTNKSASSWPLSNLHASELTLQELHETHGGYNLDDSKHLAKGIAIVLLTTLFGAAAGSVGYLTWKYHSASGTSVKEVIQMTKNILDTVKDAKDKDHCVVQDYFGESIEFRTLKNDSRSLNGELYKKYVERYFRDNEVRYDAGSLCKRLAHIYKYKFAKKRAHISGGIGGLAGLALGFYLNARKHASQAEPIVSA